MFFYSSNLTHLRHSNVHSYKRVFLFLFVSIVFLLLPTNARAQIAINGDCNLVVPLNPLSAQGLATPYQLYGADVANNGPCHEADRFQSVMVQAAIFDPATGQISVYNPLVVDYGTQPIIPPVVPSLPPNAVVAIWGGTNVNNVTLVDNGGSLTQGNCINGIPGSIFGQNWSCNAAAFFTAARAAISSGKLVVPAPGIGLDGLSCPTVDDFAIVDQDPHDNVTTSYLALLNNGAMAQFNAANAAVLSTAQIMTNGSDERSITTLDQALGCNPLKAPDLSNPGLTATALPLNELQASVYPPTPAGLVEAGDPFTFDANGNPNLKKLNLYRQMVGEVPAASLTAPDADTKIYCQNLYTIAPARIMFDKQFTQPRTSPDPYVANNLFTFLAQRFVTAYDTILTCKKLINKTDPMLLKMDINGVTIDASLATNYNSTVPTSVPITPNLTGNPIPTIPNPSISTVCTIASKTINDKAINIKSFNPNEQIAVNCTPTPNNSMYTILSVSLCLEGIGSCGNNAKLNGGTNANPQHNTRNVTIVIADATNNPVVTQKGSIIYASSTGLFMGSIDMGTLASGTYTIKEKADGFLTTQISGTASVTSGITNTIPTISATFGDINNDNQVDVSDYNVLLNCYGSKQTTASCLYAPTTNYPGADINDDGQINQVDVNLFFQAITVLHGA